MSGVLVDSDVLIDVLRERKAPILQEWRVLADSGEVVCCSPVSIAEIRHGVRGPEEHIVERLFSALTCISIGEEVGRLAGDYLRAFHKSHGVMLGDALIAATASVYGLALWTQNRKHFPMKGIRFFGQRRVQ